MNAILRDINLYIQFWWNSTEWITKNIQLIIHFIILNSMIHDFYYYNWFITNEIAVIIIQSENDNESLNRNIIIQYWNISEL